MLIYAMIYIIVRADQSRAQTLFRKIKKGSSNTAIQCLVPKEFNQSRNHVLMSIYAVKIEGVPSCMACVIESCCQEMLYP